MARRRRFLYVFLAVLFVLAVLRVLGGGRRPVAGGWSRNVGHRGSPLFFPENTLASFRAALEAGAGGLELDVRLTQDGCPVVIHDPTVDRTTDGSGPVSGITLGEMRRLNARTRDGAKGGHPVPTLAEVLERFPEATVNIDIKEKARPGAEAAVLGEIRRAGACGRVLVVSEHHGVVRRFRGLAGPEVATGASRPEIGVFLVLSALRAEGLARPAYAALQVPPRLGVLRIVTPRFVAAAHSRGVRVDAWTIDESAEMRRLLGMGVDAIMTNRPETLAWVLREKARESPRISA